MPVRVSQAVTSVTIKQHRRNIPQPMFAGNNLADQWWFESMRHSDPHRAYMRAREIGSHRQYIPVVGPVGILP